MVTIVKQGKFSEFGISSNGYPNYVQTPGIKMAWSQYVPYAELSKQECPTSLDITNQSRRVYLRPCLGSLQNVYVSTDVANAFDSKNFLDLGVAPLQRIVNDMKSLTCEVADDSTDYKTGKVPGLLGYCDYLVGNSPQSRQEVVKKSIINSR